MKFQKYTKYKSTGVDWLEKIPDEWEVKRLKDVVNSTKMLKDSAFKVLYHLMPGLPGSTNAKDLKNFKEIFTNPDFKPDMVKYYPCLVIKGTKLYFDYKKGLFKPLLEKKSN
jgi:elongator complex protein 3